MIQQLKYKVEFDGNENYLIYMDDKFLNNLDLPSEILDEISSFGVKYDASSMINIGETICLKLHKMLTEFWNAKDPLPVITFSGAINKFDDAFKNRSIVLFFTNNTDTEENQIIKYQNTIRMIPRITFLASPNVNNFAVFTLDHKFINDWFGNVRYSNMLERNKLDKFDLTKRMKEWYPDKEQYETLTKNAEAILAEFVLAKKVNIFIPGYLVVPIFHARRYQKALNLIKEKYNPVFTMTLPISIKNIQYTVLFPICKDINRGNFNTIIKK